MIDLAGIGNLLEYLVAADNITCEERDRIILLFRIQKKRVKNFRSLWMRIIEKQLRFR